jgi:geranylgeranyl diphosphate synthase, type II
VERKKKKISKIMIKRDRALVNRALWRCLRKLKGPSILRRAMKYMVFPGGKRLRPILVLESSRVLKGGVKRALPFACAVEFIHNFSLIHDDLPSMDNDDTRRGKPACHKKFGEAQAILTGDGMLSLAFKTVSESKHKKATEITHVLADASGESGMIGGQTLDIRSQKSEVGGRKVKRKINEMKTAALIAASCAVGALAAGGGSRDVKRIYEYGRNFGLAFQIADDMKDGRFSRRTLGKMNKEAKFFISKAKRSLAPFGEKADTLLYIADNINEKIAR